MKKYINIIALIVVAIAGCKDNSITEPALSTNYSGKYQNVYYNDQSIEPRVALSLVQQETSLSGTGNFNGIVFNFTGTMEEQHVIITFDLLNTNVGDLRNCTIDGYFGNNYVLAGGYTLSSQMGTEKIRFRLLERTE